MKPIFLGYFFNKEDHIIEAHCENEDCHFNSDLRCRSTNILLNLKLNKKLPKYQIECNKYTPKEVKQT